MKIIDEKKFRFDDTLSHLKKELSQIRTGRANPALIENILIESYGTKMPLNQMSNISTPDPKSLLIQPWDTNIIKDIEKSLQNSNLGLNPINEGHQLRLPIPPLTEERRKELAKVCNEKVENAKISVRNVREEIWKELKEQKNNGDISEDDMYSQQKELQKIVDTNNILIKETGETKEKEILTI